QPPAGGSPEEVPSIPSGQPVHGGRRGEVRRPCEAEDRPEVEPAAPREERPQRHGGVGRQRRNDVFERRERGDQDVQQSGREPLEEREKISRWRACSRSATASPALASPLPIHPIPSFVFAFTEPADTP